MDAQPTPFQGATSAASDLAYHIVGRNPKTVGLVLIALIIVSVICLIGWIVCANKLAAGKSGMQGGPPSNLLTGGNNPQWQNQFGDAGWGGSMHSTYQPGQARVWGASAEGGHSMATVPQLSTSCNGKASPAAVGEAHALVAAQAAGGHDGSAKNMDDSALESIMRGN